MKQQYSPSPIDTSDIQFPEHLQSLVEQLAKNVHEVWAQGRISEGWTFGPVRNDALKQHPCLIPYEELPESEKNYDRETAMTTIKLLIKLGYELRKK
ncbi:MAG: Ryanodine receptor Ryr [Bacteroidales bacterium]|nr:Ryanodine receptor Ryr [Bacteroidales bacterium]